MQKLTITIGPAVTVELESPDLAQLIKDAAFWSELPQACPLCRANVVFFYRNPKGNDYFGLHCIGPKAHETNFGQFKETAKGFYYKGASSWKESQVNWDTEVRDETVQAPANAMYGTAPAGTKIEAAPAIAQATTANPAVVNAPPVQPSAPTPAPPANPRPAYRPHPDDDIPF